MGPKPIEFTKSELRDIIRLFVKERKSTGCIGKKYNVSCNTIIKALRSNGIEVNLSAIRTKPFSTKQRAAIVKRYALGKGESTVELAKDFNCSYATIRRVLREEDVHISNAAQRTKIIFTSEEESKILEDYANGDSANGISKRVGCCDGIILAVLRKHGINTRDFGRGHRNTIIRDTGLRKTCRSLSRRIYKDHKDFINPKGHRRSVDSYHVDHRLSLHDGFLCGLTVLDLAHPVNLKMITAAANLSKYKKSGITKRELLDGIKKWNKEFGDPFAAVNMEIKYSYRYGRYKYYSGTYTHFIRYHK